MQATRAHRPEARSSEAMGHEGQNMEELSLSLYGGEMRALEEAARQEGITVASLARYLVREYLLWSRSELGQALGRHSRRLKGGRP